ISSADATDNGGEAFHSNFLRPEFVTQATCRKRFKDRPQPRYKPSPKELQLLHAHPMSATKRTANALQQNHYPRKMQTPAHDERSSDSLLNAQKILSTQF